MGVKVSNNAFGTLSAGINTTDTTVTVDSGQGTRCLLYTSPSPRDS